MRVLLTISLLIAAQSFGVAQAGQASVQGIVLKAGGSEPLAETAVEIVDARGGPTRYTTTTDTAGQFRFTNIPPGDYRLSAARPNYLRFEYGPLTLAAGQQLQNARMELTETGAISGRILTVNGLPYPNVQVQAMKYGYENGRRVLKTVRSMLTDDLGQYRIFSLPPGQYTLMAKPLRVQSSYMYFETGPGGLPVTRLITEPTGPPIAAPGDDVSPLFFPGTTMPAAATSIEVRSGNTVRGIDVVFTPLPTHRVRGTVTGIPVVTTTNGVPPPSFVVTMRPRGETVLEAVSVPRTTGKINPATGAFELAGLAPGQYYLEAVASVSSLQPDRSISFEQVRAEIPLDVVGTDIDNVSLQLAPRWGVTGKVSIVDVPNGTASPNTRIIGVRANPGDLYGEGQAAGEFTLRLPRPGDYQLWAEIPFGGYLKSITQGSRDVLGAGLRVVSATDPPLDMVVSMKAATVSGSVVDSRGSPVTNVRTVLVPDEQREKRPDLFKSARTDAAGRFSFTGVAPGNYKVFAWRDIEDSAWLNAEFLSRYEDQGRSHRAVEGQSATVQVVLP